MVSDLIDAHPIASDSAPVDFHDHIVDRLIAERAPRLAGGAAWPVLRPLLYRILDYGKARRMAEAIEPMSGRGRPGLCLRPAPRPRHRQGA